MGYKAIIFDFDGTVADTGRGVKDSVKYALNEFQIPIGDEKQLDYFIGPPLYEGFEHVYGVDKGLSSKLVDTYRVYYSKTGIYELDPYPGMIDLISDLKKAGIKLAVASSKPKHFLDTTVKHIGTADLFDYVCGPELKNHNADKSSLIKKAIAALGVDTGQDVVMIGDRFYDIEGANSVGISSVGVEFGYGSFEELTSAGATHIAKTVEELRSLLLPENE